MKPTFELDGSRFATLDELMAEVGRVLIPGAEWGRNLDALADILRGGFGTPPDFVLRWVSSDLSRVRLGYPETVRQLELRYQACHPKNRGRVSRDLKHARLEQGTTAFEWVVEVFEAAGVELILA